MSQYLNLCGEDPKLLLLLISRFLSRDPIPQYLLLFLSKVSVILEHMLPFLDLVIGYREVLLIFKLPSASLSFLSTIIYSINLLYSGIFMKYAIILDFGGKPLTQKFMMD